MTTSILETLAIMPSGEPGERLTFEELGRYLKQHVGGDHDRIRNQRHALRDELYRDGGVQYMQGVIARVFKDPDVIRLRQEWVEHARFNNPLKRIVNEISTVYAEPAKRTVPEGQDNYNTLLDRTRFHEQMFQVGRLLNLHRSLLVGFRVRESVDGEREPVIDIATPAVVRAVLHPNDSSLVVGWLIRRETRSARSHIEMPAWTLWTDYERVQLREDFMPIVSTYAEHGLGVCPWVPVTLGPPAAGFWPGSEGEDLVAAHVSIRLTNVLLLKESKSATKLPVMQGDGTRTARSQMMDSEGMLEVADGQSATTLDLGMDTGPFRETANHILEHAAHNYGISADLINHVGTQSAEARDLMRIPLREIRKQQQIPLRRFELRFMVVMAAVVGADLSELAFRGDGGRIEFGEAQTPLSAKEEHALFVELRAAGMTNTVDHLIAMRPGLTEAEAMEIIERNIALETLRNEMMRPLMQISGSMGAKTPDGNEGATSADAPPASLDVALA